MAGMIQTGSGELYKESEYKIRLFCISTPYTVNVESTCLSYPLWYGTKKLKIFRGGDSTAARGKGSKQ
jgi:hypothetical protein